MKRFTAACLTILGLALPFRSIAQESKPLPSSVELQHPPTLSVVGNGKVAAKPDHATVRLGAQINRKTATEAQAAVNEIMNKALAEIKALGIPEKAIRTSSLNLYPIHDQQRPSRNSDDQPGIIGYSASNTVQVSLDNLDLIGKVIDAGMKTGVNRLEGVSFELRNDTEQRRSALVLAINEARAKASAMAPALEVTLGPISEVIEGGVSIEPPRPFGAQRTFMAAEMATPVQPGEVQVEASVTLRYEIRQP